MGLLRTLAIAILTISFITFVAFFGQLPALRKTPVGWLQRALCVQLPNGLRRVDNVLSGGKVAQRCTHLGQYLFYERNPVVLFIFLFLLTGSATIFLSSTIARLPWRLVLPLFVLLPAPYIFTFWCASHTAHYITPANHALRMNDYPYDHILFRPSTTCPTCHIRKPPRSKHCSFCGYCVAKCDHHCPWVNNCLGRGNYRWFLALLLSMTALQVYGAYLSWWILRPNFHFNPQNSFLSPAFRQEVGDNFVIAINIGGISVAGVGLLAAATASLPFGLFAYHCYLIWAGMTTNESQKWTEWKDDVADGFVFKGNRKELRDHHRARRTDGSRATVNPALAALLEEDEVHVPWPISNDEVLVRTRDGNAPRGQEALWKPVRSLNDIVNVYDLGTLNNLKEEIHGR